MFRDISKRWRESNVFLYLTVPESMYILTALNCCPCFLKIAQDPYNRVHFVLKPVPIGFLSLAIKQS